jgi:hypothetical protein
MTEAAASPPPTDLRNTLEELRASVAARGARRGLAGMLQEAILGFLECLMALLVDFRAGKLVPLTPAVEAGARSRREEASPDGATPGYAELSREVDQQANSMGGAVDYPSPSRAGPHFCEQKWDPVPGPAHGSSPVASLPERGEGFARPSPRHQNMPGLCAPLRPRSGRVARRAAGVCGRPRLHARKIMTRQRRNAPGVRRAFPPYKPLIQKIGFWGAGIGATRMFHYQHDLA